MGVGAWGTGVGKGGWGARCSIILSSMHYPPRSGQLPLLHNSYAILAATPFLLLFRQEFCSCFKTYSLMLRNAQKGTTITKGRVGGQRGNKK